MYARAAAIQFQFNSCTIKSAAGAAAIAFLFVSIQLLYD